MRVYCTYCSASKDRSSGSVPAIKRYISERINQVFQMANTDKVGFYILSGEFGLVEPDQLLPLYDHLLTIGEIPDLAKKVAQQIRDKGITHLHYFTKAPRDEPQIQPYIKVIEQACTATHIQLEGTILPDVTSHQTPLSWKFITEAAADARQKLLMERLQGEEEFKKLLTRNPNDGMIFFERATGYEAIGEYGLAKADYELAKSLFPLDRWKWEAQQALDKLTENVSEGGTIDEARRRIKSLKSIEKNLLRDVILAFSQIDKDPQSAAVKLRICLETFLNPVFKFVNLRPAVDLEENIRALRSKSIPEIIINHMNTIRLIGNRGGHTLRLGEPSLKPADVYSSATALVAIFEWWESNKSNRL